MAKKINPQDMTVEEKLKALYQLQTIYSEIDKIKTLRGELPLEVQDLEDEIAGLQTRVNNYQTDLNTMKAADGENRRTIDKAQALVDKYTKDLDNVRNNREFDALNKEIEFENLEIELANKRLREGAAKQRICLEEIEKIKTIIADKEVTLDDKKSELDDIISETRQKEEELREQAKKKELMIEPRLLMSYKRIRKNSRNGLGIPQSHYLHATKIPGEIKHCLRDDFLANGIDVSKNLGGRSVIYSHNSLPSGSQQCHVPMWRVPSMPNVVTKTTQGFRETQEMYHEFATDFLSRVKKAKKMAALNV